MIPQSCRVSGSEKLGGMRRREGEEGRGGRGGRGGGGEGGEGGMEGDKGKGGAVVVVPFVAQLERFRTYQH